MAGPLAGIRVVEIGGIGPSPFGAMMLADMGAEVIRVERVTAVGGGGNPAFNVTNRGRRSIAIDLTKPEGQEALLKLVEKADALTEGFRPGVMEKLGVGPEACLARNPRLVYARMTGWGQEGPYAKAAGHDINYISLAGALAHYGVEGGQPVPPLNMVGDNGGGGMFMAFGVVCGLLEAKASGKGQVIDCAMVDGAAVLMSPFHGMAAAGGFSEVRGTNMLDTGAPYYNSYECADGKYISIGPLEPQFYAELLQRLGLENDPDFLAREDRARWPGLKRRLTEIFKSKTQAQWCEVLETTDVCFAPILPMSEAAVHPHNVQRKTFIEVAGVRQPAPAPRFSRTATDLPTPSAAPGADTTAILMEWAGMDSSEIERLTSAGVFAQG
ncbi:MAG TPA: CaiB/BaiF CoA-transferase family protein [Tepidiformaceae bacterium]|nr:CaiB/BaiF CoA-transferase family protein [Tepidiformaceae bacterium]